MSRLLEFEKLRGDRDRVGPTVREAHEMAEELSRMFPRGYAVFGKRPEDPVEGDMYVNEDAEVMVYVGEEWKVLAVGGPVPTSWGSPGMPVPMPSFGPDPSVREDPDNTELLEVLRCPECNEELGARACGPRHAYLADNPLEHRLIKPLLERYQQRIRWLDGAQCEECKAPLASGSCPHPDIRGGQVRVSREHWESLGRKIGDGE